MTFQSRSASLSDNPIKRILVTGGAGFIGSAMCRYLIDDIGCSVLNVDKLTYAANPESLSVIRSRSGYEFLQADICDADAMDEAFSRFMPDAIVHLAAESHVDRSITGSEAFLQTNVRGTYVLLEAARRYWSGLDNSARERFRFLHVSTDEVFGSLAETGLFTEDTPYSPSSPYSASKAAADHLAKAWCRTYGLPVVVSNCSNNYGPCQFPEKLIPLTILNALERKPLSVYGSGLNVRDWLYVGDHVRALHLLTERGKPGRSYNIGGDAEHTNIDIVQRICGIMDTLYPERPSHYGLIKYVADRPGHDYRYAIDASRIQAELGWRPSVSLQSGLEFTVRWYLDNEAWWLPLRERVYGGARLGLHTKTDGLSES